MVMIVYTNGYVLETLYIQHIIYHTINILEKVKLSSPACRPSKYKLSTHYSARSCHKLGAAAVNFFFCELEGLAGGNIQLHCL